MTANDLYFGGPSPLSLDDAISRGGPQDEDSSQAKLWAKLNTAREAVRGVRTCLFPDEKTDSDRKLRGINEGIIEALTSPLEDLEGNPTLKRHVAAFQKLVPVVLPMQKAALTVSQDEGAIALGKALDKYDEGVVGEEYMQKLLTGLAGMSGVRLSMPGGHIRDQALKLQEDLLQLQGQGARWVERGKGSENKVYTAENGMVYKVCPIKTHILDIPRIQNEDPLYPRLCSYPLAGPHGGCPLLDRLMHAASIPGMAMADLVGLTPQGEAIFSQIDLGNKEPSMKDVAEWACDAGTKALTAQKEDPLEQMTGDASLLPIVALVHGKPVIGLDLNPRNCRQYQGLTVPFDVVTRELTPTEVKRHRGIATAVAELEKEQGRHMGGAFLKLNTPTPQVAHQIAS